MRYVLARYRREQREETYRIYITDALKNYLGINMRYVDIINYKPETRTSEEIVSNIRSKLEG